MDSFSNPRRPQQSRRSRREARSRGNWTNATYFPLEYFPDVRKPVELADVEWVAPLCQGDSLQEHDSYMQHRVSELTRGNDHLLGLHGPEVSDEALAARALFCVDPITGTTEDSKGGRPHSSAYEATKFCSVAALVHADDVIRSSADFTRQAEREEDFNTRRFAFELPIDEIFSDGADGHLHGRFADIRDDGLVVACPSDFADASAWVIRGVYQRDWNDQGEIVWRTVSLYPASTYGKERGTRLARAFGDPMRVDLDWRSPFNQEGRRRSTTTMPDVSSIHFVEAVLDLLDPDEVEADLELQLGLGLGPERETEIPGQSS